METERICIFLAFYLVYCSADFTYIDNVAHAHILAAQSLLRSDHIGGKAYFITNGEPRPFWDFIRYIITKCGCVGPDRYVSLGVAYGFAWIFETFAWLLYYFYKFKPRITRQMVFVMACHHWFSHAAATRDFGYSPIISLQQGCDRTIEFYSSNSIELMPHVSVEDGESQGIDLGMVHSISGLNVTFKTRAALHKSE